MKISGIFEAALVLAGCLSLVGIAVTAAGAAPEWRCQPTPSDALGPMYQPNAPKRSSVGQGYLLTGVVKSAKDCAPIAGARIEFWLAGPNGEYDNDHRATVLTDQAGSYRFESNYPPQYSSRPPHIHLRISAQGFKTLVIQHYPKQGDNQATFDLVLVPAGEGGNQ
jgi:protocatechuate 3,4-dioxygenase beta subunit